MVKDCPRDYIYDIRQWSRNGGRGGAGGPLPPNTIDGEALPPPPKKKYEQYIESKTKHQAITCHCSVMSAISLLLADCYLMHMFNLKTEGLNFVAITVINLLLFLPLPPINFLFLLHWIYVSSMYKNSG